MKHLISQVWMNPSRPYPGLGDEEYQSMWLKFNELQSLFSSYNNLEDKLIRIKQDIIRYSLHYRYRIPWVNFKLLKGAHQEKLFSTLRPENEKISLNDDPDVSDFIEKLYKKRLDIITEYAINPKISEKNAVKELHGSEVNMDSFVATFIIPALFGHFTGIENIEAFIESIGRAFDHFGSDPFNFYLTFDSSFLCRALREFLLSPVMREYFGEQFTVFFDFFQYPKKQVDQISFSRFQRFYTLFLTEIISPLPTAPPFITKLFRRISQKFDPYLLIVTVVLNCIIIPMIIQPNIFSVLPITQFFPPERIETIEYLRYYTATICKLPMPEHLASLPPIKNFERVDPRLVQQMVELLLENREDENERVPCITDFVAPVFVVRTLAEIEDCPEILNKLKNSNNDQVISINHMRLTRNTLFNENKKCCNTMKVFTDTHPKLVLQHRPVTDALIAAANDMDMVKMKELADKEAEVFLKRAIDISDSISKLEKVLNSTITAFRLSESTFVSRVAAMVVKNASIDQDLPKKKKSFLADPEVFYNYFANTMDNFAAKHPEFNVYMPAVARRLHAYVMRKLPLAEFTKSQPDLQKVDQRFLIRKQDVLTQLEKNGIDEKVSRLMSSEGILNPATTAVLRAVLLENPVESAAQIVKALATVEDLFTFEFGEPPEANQLMPLLAHLFILSPVPTPLSFGRWLAHFLQPLVERRKEWFYDESMRSLEHYFQFNLWMEDMIPDFSP